MKKKLNKAKKILLTGGHAATTAMAVVEELTKRGQKHLSWVGSKKAIEGKDIPTLENKALLKLGVKVYPITAGRLQRRFTIWTIPSFLKIPLGFGHAFFILRKIKPDIILSFGGYAAFPVVVVGKLLGIPVILHEQTTAVGRVNKYSAPFAVKIALARKESEDFFPKEKTILVGNPIMGEILNIRPKENMGNPPVLFVTAGSRGSESINDLVRSILDRLLKDFLVIHQTGFLDFERFIQLKRNLPFNLKKRYDIYSTINPTQMPSFYQGADIIISRAGANTVSEIMATKRPALLIPLPFAYQDEQRKNAYFAQDYGVAKVINQENLTADKLLSEIYQVRKNWQKMVMRVKAKPSPDEKAAIKLVNLIEEII